MYHNSKNYIDFLYHFKNKDVVLFAGNGINGKGLIPSWNDLIIDLLRIAIDERLSINRNKEERDRLLNIFKENKGKRDWTAYEKVGLVKRLLKDQYAQTVKKYLYKNIYGEKIKTILNEGAYLKSIVEFCKTNRVKAIVNYNFDDLLDQALRKEGIDITVIYGKKQEREGSGGLPVYHVHGILPFNDEPLNENANDIILCLEEYFQSMIEPYNWQTATQLHLLRNNPCLFLGASLADLNMLRILSAARHYMKAWKGEIFTLMCEDDFFDDNDKENYPEEEQNDIIQLWATLLDEEGVRVIISGSDYNSLHPFINNELNKKE